MGIKRKMELQKGGATGNGDDQGRNRENGDTLNGEGMEEGLDRGRGNK